MDLLETPGRQLGMAGSVIGKSFALTFGTEFDFPQMSNGAGMACLFVCVLFFNPHRKAPQAEWVLFNRVG